MRGGLLAGCLFAAQAFAQSEPPAPAEPVAGIAAILTEPLLSEVSGAAGSRRDPNLLWLINDSGNGARLFALGTDGVLRADLAIAAVRNHDWEDLAVYDHGNGPRLAIADVGDNAGVRETVQILILPEPLLPAADSTLEVQRTLTLTYPDEPHDVESLAIDPQLPHGYLLTKRTKPPRLYRFDLDGDDHQTLQLVAPLDGMPQLSEAELQSEQGFKRYRHQPTGMDLSCDGQQLWVLTYGSIQRYQRPPDGWNGALSSAAPRSLALLPLPQAESIAFDRDCQFVYVLSELSPVPIVRYRLH